MCVHECSVVVVVQFVFVALVGSVNDIHCLESPPMKACLPVSCADIRSWWEVPCIAHFCHIFQKPLKLPEFEIEVSQGS